MIFPATTIIVIAITIVDITTIFVIITIINVNMSRLAAQAAVFQDSELANTPQLEH